MDRQERKAELGMAIPGNIRRNIDYRMRDALYGLIGGTILGIAGLSLINHYFRLQQDPEAIGWSAGGLSLAGAYAWFTFGRHFRIRKEKRKHPEIAEEISELESLTQIPH